MSWRSHPTRTKVDPENPRAWATCDRSGFQVQHDEMLWQLQWAGTQIVNERFLVHPDFWDEPQRQLGSLILPPDPPPIMNARPENYLIDEIVSTRVMMDGSIRTLVQTKPGPEQKQRVTVGGA